MEKNGIREEVWWMGKRDRQTWRDGEIVRERERERERENESG